MKTLVNLIASLLAFIFLIQPCPAPFLAVVGEVGAIAGAAVGLEAAAAAAEAAEEAAIALSFIGKRDVGSNQCHDEMTRVAKNLRLESPSANRMTIHNCPASCKNNVKAWNSRPDIAKLNRAYGRIAWSDSTNAFVVTEIPEKLQPHVKKAMDSAKKLPKPPRRT